MTLCHCAVCQCCRTSATCLLYVVCKGNGRRRDRPVVWPADSPFDLTFVITRAMWCLCVKGTLWTFHRSLWNHVFMIVFSLSEGLAECSLMLTTSNTITDEEQRNVQLWEPLQEVTVYRLVQTQAGKTKTHSHNNIKCANSRLCKCLFTKEINSFCLHLGVYRKTPQGAFKQQRLSSKGLLLVCSVPQPRGICLAPWG